MPDPAGIVLDSLQSAEGQKPSKTPDPKSLGRLVRAETPEGLVFRCGVPGTPKINIARQRGRAMLLPPGVAFAVHRLALKGGTPAAAQNQADGHPA